MPRETQNELIKRPLSLVQRTILEYLTDVGSASSQEIQAGCSLGQSSVDYSLGQLLTDGLVVRHREQKGARSMRYQVRIE